MNDNHLLLIPVTGPLQVFHVVEKEPDHDTLLHNEGTGQKVNLTVRVDGGQEGVIEFLHDPTGNVNPRAREALTMLTGTHMIFTGPVLFSDIPSEKVFQIVSGLS